MNRMGRSLRLAMVALAAAVGGTLDGRLASADPEPSTGVMGNSAAGVGVSSGSGQALDDALAATDLGTGAARSSIPIVVPPARGGAQPRLALTYLSSSGLGAAGVGWSLGVPSIWRQNLAGAPTYAVDSNGQLVDRVVFMGKPLVPICIVGSGCDKLVQTFPSWATGAQLFLLENDTLHARFFYLRASETWRIQLATGEVMELGLSDTDGNGLDHDSRASEAVFRWNIVHDRDANGNSVDYRWMHVGGAGIGYLSDVYDTLTAGSYAHHVHVNWEVYPQTISLAPPMWRSYPALRISGIDVTSATFMSTVRMPVRRYHMTYEQASVLDLYRPRYSYLQKVQVEGTCTADQPEKPDGTLDPTGCPSLPATYFTYTPETSPPVPATLKQMGATPAIKWLPNVGTDLVMMDLNNDGLVDALQAPHPPGTTQTIWLNDGKGNLNGTAAVTSITPNWLSSATLQTMFQQPTTAGPPPSVVTIGDLTGCGRPSVIWSTASSALLYDWAQASTNSWSWIGRDISSMYTSPLADSSGMALRSILGDIDGDGYLDRLVPAPALPGHSANALYVQLTDKTETYGAQRTGAVSPFTKSRYIGDLRFPNDAPPSLVTRALADMNGDGLADLVEADVTTQPNTVDDPYIITLRYVPGDGTGAFTQTDGTLNNPVVISETLSVWTHGFGVFPASNLQFADVSGDGIADVIALTHDSLQVYLFDGGHTLPIVAAGIPLNQAGAPFTSSGSSLQIADVDGDGVNDVVVKGYHEDAIGATDGWVWYVSLANADPTTRVQPGLLHTIDNSRNLHIDIDYATTLTAPERSNWTTSTPQVVPIVKTITRTNGVVSAATGNQTQTATEEYTYTNPEYDGWKRTFLGFQTVEVRHYGSASGTTLPTHTRSTFFYQNPFDDLGSICFLDTTVPRTTAEAQQVIQGAPILEERWSEVKGGPGPYLEMRHIGYGLQVVASGSDGREVAFAWPREVDTFLYDSPGNGTYVTLTDLFEVGGGSSRVAKSYTVPFNFARLATIRELDRHGNETSYTDLGQVTSTLGTMDGAISRAWTWQLPLGDTTGWNFRKTAETLSGDAGGSRSFTYGYFPNGNLQTVKANLTGTVGLNRASSGAPEPANESHDGTVVEAVYTYDPSYGQLTQVTRPDGRCTQIAYDPLFGQLPTSVTSYVSGCGSAPLTTGTTYDRGFAVPTSTTNLNGAMTFMTYDGFGRLSTRSLPGSNGSPGGGALTTMQYVDPSPGAPTLVHAQTSGAGVVTADAWTYSDGFGQGILSLTTGDTSYPEGGQWVASGLGLRDYEGNVVQSAVPWFWSGDPKGYAITSSPPTTQWSKTVFDAFGRPTSGTNLAGKTTWQLTYHALSVDAYDAEQLALATPAPLTTTVKDGHGRTIRSTRSSRDGSDTVTTSMGYLATGELWNVTLRHSKDMSSFTHWMQYDSLGRMVFNFEPNSGTSGQPTTGWTYAYDDAGDSVGTLDARGCGENMAYDGLGRLAGEDYVPCTPGNPWSAALEAVYTYDSYESGQARGARLGLLAAVQDLGAHTRFDYDARGAMTGTQRQIAAPDGNGYSDAWYTTPGSWFSKAVSYDALGREARETTGADITELLSPDSSFSFVYGGLGNVTSVTSSYGDGVLFSGVQLDADGAFRGATLHDAALTTISATYDPDPERRLIEYKVSRTALNIWKGVPAKNYTAPPAGSTPTVVTDLQYEWDPVGETLESIHDARADTPTLYGEWLSGAKPVDRWYAYDPFDRVSGVSYVYRGGPGYDPQIPETTSTNRDPVPARTTSSRVKNQWFNYDWLGNPNSTDDDQHAFYDRSLGTITYNAAHPNQLATATGATYCTRPNPRVPPQCANDSLQTTYDAAGNLTGLLVSRKASSCTDPSGYCTHRFVYEWDEVGQLVHARRWDYLFASQDPFPAVPTATAQVDLAYAYSQGMRVRKTATLEGTSSLEIFPTLRLNHATYDPIAGYKRDASTETAYLAGGLARVFYSASLPTATGNKTHVFYELGDHIGSTNAVIDQDTGELVQATSYQGYGAPESDFSDPGGRWQGFREDYRFTGKEDDREVGLTYFGARYYHAALGRWASPDPLTVHTGQGDPNAYAYVHGAPHTSVNPLGLDDFTPQPGDIVFPPGYITAGLPVSSVDDAGGNGGDDSAFSKLVNDTARRAASFIRGFDDADMRTRVTTAASYAPGAPIVAAVNAGDKIVNAAHDGGVGGALAAADDIYLQTFVPAVPITNGIVDTASAIAQGDDRRAGQAAQGTLSHLAAVGMAAAGVLETPGAAVDTSAEEAGAALEPYGGPGGGHHVPAKSAFAGAPGYDPSRALAIPNAELARLGVSHSAVTGAQMSGYLGFARSGAALTWDAMSAIETNALVRGGMPSNMAAATVARAISALQEAGVTGPTRIPWGG